MEIKVLLTEDPGFVLRRAGAFLSSQPVHHNLVLSILHVRVTEGDPGRYWMATRGRTQSALQYSRPHISSNADTHGTFGGSSNTAAMFAGRWSERSKSAATPFQGSRLYELSQIAETPGVEGRLRQAGPKDRSLMILWTHSFQREIAEPADDIELHVDRYLAAGQLWLWDRSGETLSMAVSREPLRGVVRLSGVYTPPEKRGMAMRRPAFMRFRNSCVTLDIAASSTLI